MGKKRKEPTTIEAIEQFCAWWNRTHKRTPKAVWGLMRALANATDGRRSDQSHMQGGGEERMNCQIEKLSKPGDR